MSITQRFSYARVLWLGMGNNTLSNWTAFDYRYFNANSFWNSLTEHQKYRKLTLRKNQTGTLSYKDGSGTIRNLDFTYAFSFNAGNTVFVSFDGQFGTTHTIKADTGPNGLDIEFDTVTTSTYFPPDVQGGTSSYNYYYKRVP